MPLPVFSGGIFPIESGISADMNLLTMRRVVAAIVTVAAVGTTAAAVRSDLPPRRQVLADMADFDRAFIPALALTSRGRQDAAVRVLGAVREEWDRFVAQWPTFGSGPDWAATLASVDRDIAAASAAARQGDLTASHDALERVRHAMADLRRRNGLVYYLDLLTAYHDPMEDIVALARDAGTGPMSAAAVDRLRQELLPLAAERFRAVETATPDPVIFKLTDEEADRVGALVEAERVALDQLQEEAAQGAAGALPEAARALLPPFVSLYTLFGGLGGS